VGIGGRDVRGVAFSTKHDFEENARGHALHELEELAVAERRNELAEAHAGDARVQRQRALD
jgi:hypothetical protein